MALMSEPLPQEPAWRYLWGKKPRGAEESADPHLVHRLVYHLIDTGQMLLCLLRSALPPSFLTGLSHALGLSEEEGLHLLPALGGMHDVGKAGPCFQSMHPPTAALLEERGLSFSALFPRTLHHGILSAYFLSSWLRERFQVSEEDAGSLAVVLGGHHGVWPISWQLKPGYIPSFCTGDGAWEDARRGLGEAVLGCFAPLPSSFALTSELDQRNGFFITFGGLVSAADWIASDSRFFPLTADILDIDEYARCSARRAEQALRQLGWLGWKADGLRPSFRDMFGPDPYPWQDEVLTAAQDAPLPALLLLEAPTGSGKTEAALALADRWLQRMQGAGLYVAMPTQATSNQMFQRVKEVLGRRYPGQRVNLQLVHGAALLSTSTLRLREAAVYDADGDPAEGSVRSEDWFRGHKQALLAPFGVGTVDQALLSVLQTRHFFMRLTGLAHKVVLFDEVHAYEFYTSLLFAHLLRWLRAQGTSVILLSATLSESTRRELVGSWTGTEQDPAPAPPYPRATLVTGQEARTFALPRPPSRRVQVERIGWSDDAPVAYLKGKLAGGGCAAVICNRVDRAQAVYQFLLDQRIVPQEDLILFHARFLRRQREAIERRVLARFTKQAAEGGKRPVSAIVVATQVLEQSLDVDFDLLVSDLAPVDFVIQRVGRLQRFGDRVKRPAGLSSPTLALALPLPSDGVPDFGPDQKVYDLDVLLKSWAVLDNRPQLTLPDDTTQLIEAVYGGAAPQMSPKLTEAVRKAQDQTRMRRDKDIGDANCRLIGYPHDEDLIKEHNEALEEEDPKVSTALKALTRSSPSAINLICLFATPVGLALEPGGTPLKLDAEPDDAEVQALLGNTVSVQRAGVVQYFLKSKSAPKAWKKVSPLRYHFLAVFDAHGNCPLPGAGVTLHLSDEKGLEFRRN